MDSNGYNSNGQYGNGQYGNGQYGYSQDNSYGSQPGYSQGGSNGYSSGYSQGNSYGSQPGYSQNGVQNAPYAPSQPGYQTGYQSGNQSLNHIAAPTEWKTWFKVLLWIGIVVGCFGVLSGISGFFFAMSQTSYYGSFAGVTAFIMLIMAILAAVSVAVDVGLLKMKPWAFKAYIVLCVINIVIAIIEDFGAGTSAIGSLLGTILGAALYIFLIYSGTATTNGKNPFE